MPRRPWEVFDHQGTYVQDEIDRRAQMDDEISHSEISHSVEMSRSAEMNGEIIYSTPSEDSEEEGEISISRSMQSEVSVSANPSPRRAPGEAPGERLSGGAQDRHDFLCTVEELQSLFDSEEPGDAVRYDR